METIYKASGRRIPAVLADSKEFKSLNDVQQENFCARMRYIEEICLKSKEWLQSREGFESTYDFIDEIEQDLLINLGSGEKGRSVSLWLIHSSWTFNSSPRSMLPCLPQCLADDSAEGMYIGMKCDELEFLDWVNGRIHCVDSLLNIFYEANSFDCAIGSLVGIDIGLGMFLLGVSKQRFNQNLV